MTTPLEVLRRRGWHKGWYTNGDGKVCMLGARQVAEGNGFGYLLDRDRDWYTAVGEVIAEQFPERAVRKSEGLTSVAMFNDHPATTFEDVEAVLEKAEIRLSEQVQP